jgi:23S rRNA (cytosine1962-C5)-methyltransferase
VSEYQRKHGMEEEEYDAWQGAAIEIMARVIEVPSDKIFMRQRRRLSHRGSNQQYEKLATDSTDKVVQEAGLSFKVNLTDYLDSGLFLDHRMTRQMVREMSQGAKVLNLFCYTGSFSVYAVDGGAAEVRSVDLSKTYLTWAEENMKLNELYDPNRTVFEHADVLQYVQTLPADYYDLVIMDPPTFSNSKRMKEILDIQQDHVWLLNAVLKSVKPGGTIIFSNNYRKFELLEAQIKASSIKDITNATVPFDFQGKLIRKCYRIEK